MAGAVATMPPGGVREATAIARLADELDATQRELDRARLDLRSAAEHGKVSAAVRLFFLLPRSPPARRPASLSSPKVQSICYVELMDCSGLLFGKEKLVK